MTVVVFSAKHVTKTNPNGRVEVDPEGPNGKRLLGEKGLAKLKRISPEERLEVLAAEVEALRKQVMELKKKR